MYDIRSQPLICIADDDPINVKLTSYMLGRDYQICVATAGEAALATVSEQQPDLILLDIMMEDIDGFDVCEQLKRNPHTCNIPIIFMSGLENDNDQVKGFEAGASDYITKPVSSGLLKMRVKRVLQEHYRTQFLKSLLTTHHQTVEDLQMKIGSILEEESKVA